MTSSAERRRVSDRRRFARGGRRAGDRDGYAPLILLVDDDADRGGRCEALLLALKFAVAPAATIEEAVRVTRALRPNLIVTCGRLAGPLQTELQGDPPTAKVPVITMSDRPLEPESLLDAIRRALRVTPIAL
jgi:CheY-like chemotaxis protein